MATRREVPQIRARGGVQYLSGGVRRECAGMRPSRKSPAAPWEPRVLSPHRLLGAAIFLPRPSMGRATRSVRHFRQARGGSEELQQGLGRPQGRVALGQRGRGLRCFHGDARYPGVAEASEERLRATASPHLLPRDQHPWRVPRGLVLGWAGPAGGCSRAACSYLLVLLDCQEEMVLGTVPPPSSTVSYSVTIVAVKAGNDELGLLDPEPPRGIV